MIQVLYKKMNKKLSFKQTNKSHCLKKDEQCKRLSVSESQNENNFKKKTQQNHQTQKIDLQRKKESSKQKNNEKNQSLRSIKQQKKQKITISSEIKSMINLQQVQHYLDVFSSQKIKFFTNLEIDPESMQRNILFYKNKLISQPNGTFIEQMHKNWRGNFQLLENHHGFIQWLFPNGFQSKFNKKSFPLTHEEAQIFRNDIQIAERIVTSYQMMLEFYGIKLINKEQGILARSRIPNYETRFKKTFLSSFHNHLRITRILNSLQICGFSKFSKNLSLFLYYEIYDQKGALRDLKESKVYERQWIEYSKLNQPHQEQRSIYFQKFKKGKKKPQKLK